MFNALLVNRLSSGQTNYLKCVTICVVSYRIKGEEEDVNLPIGIIMMRSRMMIPTVRMIFHFILDAHIFLLTRFAPWLNPCADTARLSVLS